MPINKSELVKEYFKFQEDLESKYGKDSIILMECGKFFEIFGIPENDKKIPEIGQIDRLCNIMNIQKTRPNKKTELSIDSPFMCGFPIPSLDKYVDILKENSFTVGIVNQYKIKGEKKMGRKLTKIVSPTITVDLNYSIVSNYLICIYFEKKEISLCAIDLSVGKSDCYIINDNCSIKINKIIHSLSPREIVVYGEQNNKLELQKYKTHYYDKIEKKYCTLAFQNLFLQRLFPFKNMLSVIENLNLEKYPSLIVCYILMIQFIIDHDPKIIDKLHKPRIVKYDQTLQLSSNTISQLHLFSSDKNTSVFDIINKTSTMLGKRLLKERLLNPLTNIKQINRRYNEIEKMIPHCEKVQFLLKKIKDIERLHRKLTLKKLQPCEFLDIHYTNMGIIELLNYFSNNTDNEIIFENNEYLETYPCSDLMNKETIEQFRSYIDFYTINLNLKIIEKYNIDTVNDTSLFNKGIYEDIDKIVVCLKTQWDKFNTLKDNLSNVIGEKNSVRIESTNTEGYYLITSNKRKDELKDVAELKFKSQTSTCKIFSPKISSLSEKILKYQEKLQKLNEEKFIEFMTKIDDEYSECLIKMSNYIANIDFYKSGAIISKLYKYEKPVIIENYGRSYFRSKSLRHPIIERINKDSPYIANNIDIDNNTKGILLYGINNSGKSSLLRSVGIAIILAQMGYYVPCSNFEYYPFKKIYTKIALQDNLFKKESTFVAEIKEMKNMIENTDENTIVLSDELCSGTEINSAISLVSATIISLLKNNSNFIFTTHYHQLVDVEKLKKLEVLKVYHLEVKVENGVLIFNRKLKDGICPAQYGIEIAEHIGLDQNFIKTALDIRENLNNVKDKQSRYNKNVFMNNCEICKSKEELQTHHITFQKEFKKENKIPFDKNVNHNLVVLCEKCHQSLHQNKITIYGYIETSKGIVLQYEKV